MNIFEGLADVSLIHTIVKGPAEVFQLHTKIFAALLSIIIIQVFSHLRVRFTAKLIKVKLQSPSLVRGPSNALEVA